MFRLDRFRNSNFMSRFLALRLTILGCLKVCSVWELAFLHKMISIVIIDKREYLKLVP